MKDNAVVSGNYRGIYVLNSILIIEGGIIYGSDALDELKNTASSGAALYLIPYPTGPSGTANNGRACKRGLGFLPMVKK